MADDEQFSLCWNNFNSNLSAGFHESLCRGDLVDVTLAAEGQFVKAHRLVLSVCSPYFRKMFTQMPANQHAFVFLKDVSHSALKDLIQFMYCGEVNVKQEALPAFISTAEALQIKGLTDGDPAPPQTPPEPTTPTPQVQQMASSPRTRTRNSTSHSYKVETLDDSASEEAKPHATQMIIHTATSNQGPAAIVHHTAPQQQHHLQTTQTQQIVTAAPATATTTVLSHKRPAQRNLGSVPHIKRTKSTIETIDTSDHHQTAVQQQQITVQTAVVTTDKGHQPAETEYIDLPIELPTKSEPEYAEEAGDVESGEQDGTYVEDDSYGDIRYDESYFTENEDTGPNVTSAPSVNSQSAAPTTSKALVKQQPGSFSDSSYVETGNGQGDQTGGEAQASEDNDSEFSEQLREQSYFKMAKRSGGSDADDHYFMQSSHSDSSELNIDSTINDNNLKMLPKKFKSSHDQSSDVDYNEGEIEMEETNIKAHSEAEIIEKDIGGSGDFAHSESVPQQHIASIGIDQPLEGTIQEADELKIVIPDDKDEKDNGSSEAQDQQSFHLMSHPTEVSTTENEGLLMASSNVIEKTDDTTQRIAPVYEDISDDAKESSDSADNSEENENDEEDIDHLDDDEDDELQYKKAQEYSRQVLTMGHTEFDINTSNAEDDEIASIESPTNDNIDSGPQEFQEETDVEEEEEEKDSEEEDEEKDAEEEDEEKDIEEADEEEEEKDVEEADEDEDEKEADEDEDEKEADEDEEEKDADEEEEEDEDEENLESTKNVEDSKELIGDINDQSNKQEEEKSDNESGPSRGRHTSSNTSKNCEDEESIPLHVGSEIFITKNQLRRIYIPNAAIYTSRLSDVIFGTEVMEQVALSDEENKLVLLDKAKLRAILTHVVQVFTTQGMQVDDELVLHFLDHKLANLSANLKAVASQPN